jgi:uncharacterized protein YbjT (DUF2867 family)
MHILIAGGTGTAGRVLARRAASSGHSVRVLTRTPSTTQADGVEFVSGDVVAGAGLAAAMSGVDAVVDLSNIGSPFRRTAGRFFVAGTENLIAAEHAAGVAHHVLLSIVGIDTFPSGYYQAKLDQEHAVEESAKRTGVPHTIARVTQFHDFAALTYRTYRLGRLVLVPPLHVQPVHLDDVAAHLLAILEAEPVGGHAPELAGPRPEELFDMVSRYAATQADRVRIQQLPLPPRARRANEAKALQPGSSQRGTLTFDDWLAEVHG